MPGIKYSDTFIYTIQTAIVHYCEYSLRASYRLWKTEKLKICSSLHILSRTSIQTLQNMHWVWFQNLWTEANCVVWITDLLHGNITKLYLSARKPGTSGRAQSNSRIKTPPQCTCKLKRSPCTVLAVILMEDDFEMLKRFSDQPGDLFWVREVLKPEMYLLWFVEVWEVRKGVLRRRNYLFTV